MSDFEPIDFTSIDDIPGINAKALFSSELSKTEFRETGDISPVPIGDIILNFPGEPYNMIP